MRGCQPLTQPHPEEPGLYIYKPLRQGSLDIPLGIGQLWISEAPPSIHTIIVSTWGDQCFIRYDQSQVTFFLISNATSKINSAPPPISSVTVTSYVSI